VRGVVLLDHVERVTVLDHHALQPLDERRHLEWPARPVLRRRRAASVAVKRKPVMCMRVIDAEPKPMNARTIIR
jgi:hypothetical protein